MTPLYLVISIGLIWINLLGLALLCNYLIRDYTVSRIGSPFLVCLVFFFFEHFHGLGPDLWAMPFSSVLSAGLIWLERRRLRENWQTELCFGAGLVLCLGWRYAFPNIDTFEERFPDLVFLHDYYAGTTLPPLDRWLPPFKVDFYYSFQYYSAALLGRWFDLDRGVCYQVAYGIIAGLITGAIFAGVRRLCAWRPAAVIITTALLLGGCGLALVIHLSMKHDIVNVQMVRYLGLLWSPGDRTAFGNLLDHYMYVPGKNPVELPVEPLSCILLKGEFHPPLLGFLILVFSLLLIATLSGEADPRQRRGLHVLLASTVPFALIGNTWVFPLQAVLVVGWFAYRTLAGEKSVWLAGLIGAGGATLLAYPFLSHFLVQSAAHTTEFRLVRPGDHAALAEWLAVFWPVVLLLLLSLCGRERRGVTLYFATVWVLLLAGTEIFYIHDINGGTWERFNSTLKWWGWVYTGGVMTLGALCLASRHRLIRAATVVITLLPLVQAYDYAKEFHETEKSASGRLDGSYWLTRDYALRDIVSALKARPDGICIDSGNTTANTDATVLAILGNKQCLVGWPVQEGIWRLFRSEIKDRVSQVNDFYAGRMDDPLEWLLANDVRYVLWLQKDNDNQNVRFLPLWAKIKSRYTWRSFCGNNADWAVGFWERNDPPPGRH